MVSYILFVALLNLGLGFAVAAYLGRRYRAMTAAENHWTADAPYGRPDTGPPALQEQAAVTEETPNGPPAEEESGDESAQASADTTSSGPPEPQRQKSPSEESLDDFKAHVEQYHGKLARADDELRSCTSSPEATAIESCLSSLMGAIDEYLENRRPAHADFETLHQDRPEFDEVRGNLQTAVEKQDEQIESTRETINALDYQSDLAEGCRQAVAETGKLLDANNRVRDTVDEAAVEVARNEQRLSTTDLTTSIDELTGIPDRAALEANLSEWWEKDPHRARQLSVAMIDVDQFAKVNEQYGQKLGNRVLRTLARLLDAESQDGEMVARYSGQRFCFLLPDADVRRAIDVAEGARQAIETVRFRHQDHQMQITVSCAVAEASADDTSANMFQRAETALREAKRYGRNRTFIHEGSYPSPIVPPSFPVQEKEITL